MTNIDQETEALLALHAESVGSRTLFKLRSTFSSYRKAEQVTTKQLIDCGLTNNQVESIAQRKKLLPRLKEIVARYSIEVIDFHSPNYPYLLKEIADPPAVLYVRGQLPETPTVSIVGSRKFTSYGRQVTEDIATHAAQGNLTVISGLALGIDAIAHRAAIASSGKTVGVLACGVEQTYPVSHRSLAEEMITLGGGVVSEFPLFTPPYRSNFPIRNRIIAGLSRSTIVTEARLDSGALLTANLAIEYNRDVFAVPGDIYRPSSEGTNALLRMGAIPLIHGEELLDYYNITPVSPGLIQLDEREQAIVQSLTKEGTHLDQLAEALQLDIADLTSKVIMLEMKGAVKHEGAGVYRRVI